MRGHGKPALPVRCEGNGVLPSAGQQAAQGPSLSGNGCKSQFLRPRRPGLLRQPREAAGTAGQTAREQLCNKGNQEEVPLICQQNKELGCGPLPHASSVPSGCSGLRTAWPSLATHYPCISSSGRDPTARYHMGGLCHGSHMEQDRLGPGSSPKPTLHV